MDLLDIIEDAERKDAGHPCLHKVMEPTVTVWPGETCERLTMTCSSCGFVRGRFPKEGTRVATSPQKVRRA